MSEFDQHGHCTDEALLEPHSQAVLAHLAECRECQQRLWQLKLQVKQLKDQAEQLPLLQPSPMAWDKIAATLPPETHPVKVKRHWLWPVSIAASFVVGAMVMLMASQMWQSNQLDSQIALSNQYERQLVSLRLTSPWIESQLWQIAKIDQQLNQVESLSEQKQLWQQRNAILQQILQQPVNMNEMI